MKKIISFILAITMLVVLPISVFAAEISSDEVSQEDCVRVLYIMTENIRVVAPGAKIDAYLNAETDQEKAQLLSEMKTNPSVIVTDISEGELGFISVDSDAMSEVIATPSNDRTLGKWVMDNFEIQPDQIMKISRSGGIAFTVDEDEILRICLDFEGTRTFGVITNPTTPVFYDFHYEEHEGRYQCDVIGLNESGNERVFVYVKNVSDREMVVLRGSFISVY